MMTEVYRSTAEVFHVEKSGRNSTLLGERHRGGLLDLKNDRKMGDRKINDDR